jgi:predicted acetyltransferase
MGVLHSDALKNGEAFLLGTPSESAIYERFGSVPAATMMLTKIETLRSAFTYDLASKGRIRLVPEKEGLAAAPEIFNRYRLAQPGEVSRSRATWDAIFRSGDPQQDKLGDTFWALHESEESCLPDGYVVYRIQQNWIRSCPRNAVRIVELVADNEEVRARLWRYCLDLDLVSTLEMWMAVEDPLRWLLKSPRDLQIAAMLDRPALRILNPAIAMSMRGYSMNGCLRLEIHDTSLPENTGCYQLEVAGNDARVLHDDSLEADLHLSIGDLAAVFLGGARFTTLASAGRIRELRNGALRRADLMFASASAPKCQTPV